MPNTILNRPIRKRKLTERFKRVKVLNIINLATMDKMKQTSAGENGVGGGGGGGGGGEGGGSSAIGCDEFHSEFYNTGRIGRRNALPDILGTHCTTTTADLPTQMGALTTSDCPEKATSTGSTMMTNSTTAPSTSGGS